MKFIDLESEFEFEKEKKRDIKVKIRTATFFMVFLMIIFGIAKNNYNFDFSFKTKEVFTCDSNNTLHKSDDIEVLTEKIQKVVNVNKDFFKGFSYFVGTEIFIEEQNSSKLSKIPKIRVIFSQKTKEVNKVPEEICGFKTEVIYH